MLTLELWFWVTVLSALGLGVLTVLIHTRYSTGMRLSFRITQRDSAIESHKRAFRITSSLANTLQALKVHWIDCRQAS